jgi:hypothetical protein
MPVRLNETPGLPIFVLLAIVAGALWGSGSVSGQTLQKEPKREAGASVTGAFEGWYKNADGTYSLLFGYFNRNTKQEIDIPIGPANRIEPGTDRGQPTHFLTGRRWGLFAVKVPADFGKNRITWTIVANGQTTAIPGWLNVDYQISPLVSTASALETPGEGDTPPVLRFAEDGPSVQGPDGLTVERTTTVGTPLALSVWVADDARIFTNSGAKPRNLSTPVNLTWTKYRGPGAVTFSADKPEVQKIDRQQKGMAFSGMATTTATFNEPGDYVLHVVANDYSGPGGGGFQCCWTNGQVKVSVAVR